MATLVALRGLLEEAALASQRVPFWVLVSGHSLTAVEMFAGFTPSWLLSWLIGFIAAFGGGTLSALLLQSPQSAAIGLFSKNQLGICYTLVWWLYHYCPGGWAQRLAALPPVRFAAKLARATLRATTVVQRVGVAAKLYPGVAAGPIVLGTLAGAGGKLLTDAFSHCAGYSTGPYELSQPGYVLRSAALGAVLQYLLVHVLGVLRPQQGLGLVISLYVLHSLATDITGQPCDYTAPLGTLFHKVTLIPDPAKALAAAKPGAKHAAAAGPAAKPSRTPRATRGRAATVSSSPELAAGADQGEEDAQGLSTPGPRRTTRRRAAAGRQA